MAFRSRSFRFSLLFVSSSSLQVLFLLTLVRGVVSDEDPTVIPGITTIESHAEGYHQEHKEMRISRLYTDSSGNLQTTDVKPSDLSDSWVWEDSVDEEALNRMKNSQQSDDEHEFGAATFGNEQPPRWDPVKRQRWLLREARKKERVKMLINMTEDAEHLAEEEAIEHAKQFKNTGKGKYSIWRREYENPQSDSTLKLMKDQIILAKVYASIALSKNQNDIYGSLRKQIKESQHAIGEGNSDAELKNGASKKVKAMGDLLSSAKDKLYDCSLMAKKLRAMVQSAEENIHAVKGQSTFLLQLAAKVVTKPLHCLPLHLTVDYFLLEDSKRESQPDPKVLVDPSLYHYAIFSDNVLATSVVVNSTVLYVENAENHVFHIVTDKLNYPAMKMWFLVNSPPHVTVHVENMDDFKWLNSSYCSVLRQLESARLKEYYFKADRPSTLSVANDQLKYRNPKYLSMLNHIRFYLPEIYPKLDKILFLDDDIVVQKDLTPLWSIDMRGMVNGAVETCKETFHRFDTYLNFSHPMIARNFKPTDCGWAYGMNMFDLNEWRRHNLTGVYHGWQDKNVDRQLWKLGTLPVGLMTFYGLTYPLDRDWHMLGLGYDSSIDLADLKKGAVVHYNGNFKPWLDLAIPKYKPIWTKHIKYDNPYIRNCQFNE
ncbi:putative galacturonosyltransferase 3 [Acorus gramineus]|uniref:Hexosyltransferase n=1 Tax=Acorus gramineus TaxID=55184 RepID=A0AAV9B9N6_ACOGR|nr:putative galacturonosyltransferase 3 [Acorus gramineus]